MINILNKKSYSQSNTEAGLPRRSNAEAGMTLIELMVVLAIFAVVSSIVIFNYGSFQSNVSLGNLSENIALSIRRAQGYSIGVEGVHQTVGGTLFPSYGMHFGSLVGQPNFGKKSFVFFADIPPDSLNPANKQYDQADNSSCGIAQLAIGSECMEITNITTTDQVVGVCPNTDGTCSPTASVDITFTRPNQDAYFCYKPDPQNLNCDPSVSSVRIQIQSLNGTQTKTISVWNTGQIQIQ